MYFTNDISVNGTDKKQFYSSIGMQDFKTGEIVQVRQWAGEFSKKELEDIKEQVQAQFDEINSKLSLFI